MFRRRMKKQEKQTDESAEKEPQGSEAAETEAKTSAENAETERGKLEDQLRRAMADLANMRKRQAKEREDARARAIEGLSAELLPVLDNFHLALAAHEQAESAEVEVKGMLDGLVMVRSLLEGTLERHGLSEISAEGEQFDPNRHEAVGVDAESDADAGTIVRVMQRGYMIGDKVLRASRVIVAGAPQTEGEAGDGGES